MISALCGQIPDPCEAASFRCYLGKPAGRREWFNATPSNTSNPSRIQERNALLYTRRKQYYQRRKDAYAAMSAAEQAAVDEKKREREKARHQRRKADYAAMSAAEQAAADEKKRERQKAWRQHQKDAYAASGKKRGGSARKTRTMP